MRLSSLTSAQCFTGITINQLAGRHCGSDSHTRPVRGVCSSHADMAFVAQQQALQAPGGLLQHIISAMERSDRPLVPCRQRSQQQGRPPCSAAANPTPARAAPVHTIAGGQPRSGGGGMPLGASGPLEVLRLLVLIRRLPAAPLLLCSTLGVATTPNARQARAAQAACPAARSRSTPSWRPPPRPARPRALAR
jgi:hypothetical protein